METPNTERERQVTAASTAWITAHPMAHAWMTRASARGFRIATDLLSKLETYGGLTERQFALVEKFRAEDAERQANLSKDLAERAVDVGGAGQELLRASLERAHASGLKTPLLRVGELAFSLAKAYSRNPGAIYIKNGERYRGKVLDGRFFPVFDVLSEERDTVARVLRDPLAEAVRHGKESGECSCCGRRLTDPESVGRGIGPVCAKRYFGA